MLRLLVDHTRPIDASVGRHSMCSALLRLSAFGVGNGVGKTRAPQFYAPKQGLTAWYWILYDPFSSRTMLDSRSSDSFMTSS